MTMPSANIPTMIKKVLREAAGGSMDVQAIRQRIAAKFGVRTARNSVAMALGRMVARNEVAELANPEAPRTFTLVPATTELPDGPVSGDSEHLEVGPNPNLYGLDDPDKLWPEDVISEEEWERGWFDRQVLTGRRTEAQRQLYPPAFGGTKAV